MAKEARFYGRTEEEVKKLDLKEFAKLIPSRNRKALMNSSAVKKHEVLLKKIRKFKTSGSKKAIKTHCRDMIVTPEMLGMQLQIHTGKEFFPVVIDLDMLGRYLGELTMTRKKVAHSAPGIGATRSSAAVKK
ncbi:MAG TPA: ribosomal protein S19 family protein [Candidatus Nanoarchaeia archaeon]|nr:ribosomal protein S19 family protein [Candidatus Nanoarchaeia archaeon]